MKNQTKLIVMPTSAGLRFAFNDQAGGAVGRKPIARTDAKVWDHSALESRIERHSMIVCSFRPACRRLGCAKVRSGCGSKGTSMFGRRRAHLTGKRLRIAESRAIYLGWGPGCTSTRGPVRQTHGCAYE